MVLVYKIGEDSQNNREQNIVLKTLLKTLLTKVNCEIFQIFMQKHNKLDTISF